MTENTDGKDDLLKDALEAFELCQEVEAENREEALEDVRFARLGQQWPDEIRRRREEKGRPCQTINLLPPFIRQIVNDARQNRPSIKVHPAGDGADQEVAEIYNGLIRNIEVTSDASVAYDTALEHAVDRGLGYIRINTAYACEDSFVQDLRIDPVYDPATVYGDPYSMAADSAEWNLAFVVEGMRQKEFERRFKGADPVDWAVEYAGVGGPWIGEGSVQVAEWWTREEVAKLIVALSDGTIMGLEEFQNALPQMQALGVDVVGQPRPVKSYKVTQRLLTGAEVLETNTWAGKYIPIVPVYGESIIVEGKRHLRSLVRDAKEPARNVNYWRSYAAEMIALAPKAPFIGPKGSFSTDGDKWDTANVENHAFIEYDVVQGGAAPQRQPFAGVPAGAIQGAIDAANDLKAVIGMHEASLGQEGGPEQSGRAILARMREGDVSTFHYVDNLSRAIRHAGRILIDLIPKVYSTPRLLRVLGPDGSTLNVPANSKVQVAMRGPDGQPIMQPQTDPSGQPMLDAAGGPMMQPAVVEKFYDLTSGKYDLTVEAGPSFTTRREEAANQMVEVIRAYPAAAQVLAPMLAKNLDWPGADEVADAFKALMPQPGGGAQLQAMQAKLAADGQAKQAELAQNQQLAMAQLQNDTALAREKMQQQIALEREKMQMTIALKREMAAEEARLAEETAHISGVIKLAEARNHQDQTTELPETTIGGGIG